MKAVLSALLVCVLLAGCQSLPAAGPSSREIMNPAAEVEGRSFELVDIDERVVHHLQRQTMPTFASFAEYKASAEPVIGIGDIVKVTIWEAAPGNLFNASLNAAAGGMGSQGASIPEQMVPRAGTIVVPFAGDLKVAGRTSREVETAIARRLSLKAVEPQVLVNVVKSVANTVTVTGDAVPGGQIQLSPSGERVLDALALAGGVKTAMHETQLTLTRNNQVVTVPFQQVATQSRENVRLGPGDVLMATRRPPTFLAFGATGRNAEIPFDAAHVNLAQGIAKAGGLLDERADATGVFVFRVEQVQDLAHIAPGRKLNAANRIEMPVIYRLNLRDARGLFLARAFPLRPGDLLYVSNAPASELRKFLQIVQTVVSPTVTGMNLYNGIN